MIEKVIRTIEKFSMVNKGDKIIIGVSGGPDSVALLHIFNSIKDKYDLKITAVHINHNLRGQESNMDQKYVENICEEWKIPLFCESVDIDKLSKKQKVSYEVAGREFRYNFFNKVLKDECAQKIAVAHNADDNAETVLMRIIRGTGIEGLSGIKPVRDNIIRPLIEIPRSEIDFYCESNKLKPRIDSSNLQNVYTRNKIRLELIPYLKKEFNPNITNTINRMSDLIKLENSYIEEQVTKIYHDMILEKTEEYIRLKLDKINKQDILVIGRILRSLIREFSGNIINIEQRNIEDAMEFMKNSKTGSTYDLPRGLKLKKSYDELFIIKDDKNQKDVGYCYKINIPGTTQIEEARCVIESKINDTNAFDYSIDEYTQMFDYDKIKGVLEIRTRNDGDFFRPLGMKGKKKLKDFYIDEKIPKDLRDTIPLIAYKNEVIWIVGKRISETYKVDTNTRKILLLCYKKM